MSKKNHINRDKTLKQFDLSQEELAELSFYSRMHKEKEIEMNMWAQGIFAIRDGILQRVAIGRDKYEIDWTKVLTEGKVFAKLKPEPKVEIGKEEKKENVGKTEQKIQEG